MNWEKSRFPLVLERGKVEGGWSLMLMLIEDQKAAFWVVLNNTDRSFCSQDRSKSAVGSNKDHSGVTQSSGSFLDQLHLVRIRHCSRAFQGDVS